MFVLLGGQNPEEWEHPSDSSLSEDVEMLLECYEQEVCVCVHCFMLVKYVQTQCASVHNR